MGDIGDYGKYGLLRAVAASGLRLAVNWYRVIPPSPEPSDPETRLRPRKKNGAAPARRKPQDGRYTEYLSRPAQYSHYDPALFDCLAELVQRDRRLEALQASGILQATFYAEPLTGTDRRQWHAKALDATRNGDVVFLDPDNGLETARMHRRRAAAEKHVTWQEAKDYYDRGQSVILYQHRPQRTAKARCIQGVLDFQASFLRADRTLLLEYPRYTNRYYFLFAHREHSAELETVCHGVAQDWQGLCRFLERQPPSSPGKR